MLSLPPVWAEVNNVDAGGRLRVEALRCDRASLTEWNTRSQHAGRRVGAPGFQIMIPVTKDDILRIKLALARSRLSIEVMHEDGLDVVHYARLIAAWEADVWRLLPTEAEAILARYKPTA